MKTDDASIKRLKARIYRVVDDPFVVRDAIKAIDAWRKAERKRGGR